MYLLSLCLLLIFSLASEVKAQVVFNELMANNVNAVTNGTRNPDWIELYNSGTSPYSLAGFGLSDTNYISGPMRYVFPATSMSVVPAGGRLVVWMDTDYVAPGLHSGFTLKNSGKAVHLYTPGGGFQADSIVYGPQAPDVSIGRVPDGITGVWTLTQPTPGLANKAHPVASVTNLIINEWMATNSTGFDWLEVYNRSTNPVALAGLVFTSIWPLPATGPTNRPVAALSYIGGEGFVQLFCSGNQSKNANDLDFKLSHNAGETVTLYPGAGSTNNWIDQIRFPGNNAVPGYWSADISYGRYPDGAANILRFDIQVASPGFNNFLPITNVVVNEALSNTDPPLEDAIELYNPTANRGDISYWWISNTRNSPKKFQVPPNTFIEAGGYKVFYEQRGVTTLPHTGFNTSGFGNFPDFSLSSSKGDSVQVFTADAAGKFTGYETHASFGAGAKSVSFGRFLTSVGDDFTAMSSNTFGMDHPATLEEFRTGTGGPNAYPKMGPLIISEIMYHPPNISPGVDNTLDEYIEVYNISTNTIFLYDTNGLYCCDTNHNNYADGRTNAWTIQGIVNFDFPTNVSLGAGQSLLVLNFSPSGNPAQLTSFQNKYGVPANVQVFGPYTNKVGKSGSLTNSGGRIELFKPDSPQDTNHVDFRFVPYLLVDKVVYSNAFPWPAPPDGTGKALQRLVPDLYGNDPVNWAAANPTPGWQPLHIDSAKHAGDSLVLGFNGLAGSSYSIQYKAELGVSNWTPLTNLSPLRSSGLQQITDPLSPPPAKKFYRLVTPSQP